MILNVVLSLSSTNIVYSWKKYSYAMWTLAAYATRGPLYEHVCTCLHLYRMVAVRGSCI